MAIGRIVALSETDPLLPYCPTGIFVLLVVDATVAGTERVALNSIAVCFNKSDYEAAELFRFLKVHQMAGVFDDDAARIGNSGFDHARVSVNVRNIHAADED